jgi:catechol 2,3-dioxygenase-like lactoylglutathione lyase family enzyme
VPPKIRFLYAGVRVRDLERSIRFYTEFGMKVVTRGTMSHGGEYVHLAFPRSPVRLELNYYPEGNKFYTPWKEGAEFDHLGFYATDARGALAKLRKAGGVDAIPAWDEPTSHIGYVNDPDGVTIEVFGPLKAPRRKRRAKRKRSA